MRSVWTGLMVAVVLGAAAAAIVPPAWQHWQIVEARDDPIALSRLRLDTALTQQSFDREVDAALMARDAELVESFFALAGIHGLVITSGQQLRLDALKAASLTDAIADFGHGFVAGDRDSPAASVGALTSDITGIGDLRDLAIEGRKWLAGENADMTVVAIAAAGLALSAATVASLGGVLPARNGLSLVKSATKAKLLSPALTASLARTASQALDGQALRTSLSAAARFDIGSARAAAGGILRPAALGRLTALGQDAGALYRRTGHRGLRQVLAVADDAADLGRASKLAAASGTTMRATLKVLGRGALVLGTLSLTAMGWMVSLLGYVLAIAMLAQRIGWWLGRRIMPRRAKSTL